MDNKLRAFCHCRTHSFLLHALPLLNVYSTTDPGTGAGMTSLASFPPAEHDSLRRHALPSAEHSLHNRSRHRGRDDIACLIFPNGTRFSSAARDSLRLHTFFPSGTLSFSIKCDLAHIIRLFSQLSLRAVVEKTIFFADKNILGTFYE